MKKILVLLMVLALSVPYFFAEDVEAVAGEGNYKIDMKLHNFVREAYGNKIATEICLPISTYFKMYIDASFSDNTDMSTVNNAISPAYFNNYLKLYVGSNVTENVSIGILVGGGTNIPYFVRSALGGSAQSLTTQSGEGVLFLGLGLKLKSAMFGDKINDIYVRQLVTLHLSGSGNAEANAAQDNSKSFTGIAINGGKTQKQDDGKNEINLEYFGVNYDGVIGTGVKFDVGLPKFALAFEIGYGVGYVGYSKVNTISGSTTTDIYDALPAKTTGNVNLKINLQINYTPAVETETWIKPEFSGQQNTWTLKGGKAQVYTVPAFNLYVGANWKATFAKIVFLKFDCEWKLSVAATQQVDGLAIISSNGTVATLFNKVDPGITLGFNFEGWTLEMKWKPRLAFGQSIGEISNSAGTFTQPQTNVDSNVFNLAMWDIGVSCSFPPPTK